MQRLVIILLIKLDARSLGFDAESNQLAVGGGGLFLDTPKGRLDVGELLVDFPVEVRLLGHTLLARRGRNRECTRHDRHILDRAYSVVHDETRSLCLPGLTDFHGGGGVRRGRGYL
jgi:hypothetical protein